MPRPRLCRKIEFNPNITYFKPQGVPMRELEIVELTAEEIEAYRLRHINDMEQQELTGSASHTTVRTGLVYGGSSGTSNIALYTNDASAFV